MSVFVDVSKQYVYGIDTVKLFPSPFCLHFLTRLLFIFFLFSHASTVIFSFLFILCFFLLFSSSYYLLLMSFSVILIFFPCPHLHLHRPPRLLSLILLSLSLHPLFPLFSYPDQHSLPLMAREGTLFAICTTIALTWLLALYQTVRNFFNVIKTYYCFLHVQMDTMSKSISVSIVTRLQTTRRGNRCSIPCKDKTFSLLYKDYADPF